MFDMAAEVMPPCMTGHFPIACDISFMALPLIRTKLGFTARSAGPSRLWIAGKDICCDA